VWHELGRDGIDDDTILSILFDNKCMFKPSAKGHKIPGQAKAR
jgi:hypothetical protein